MFSVNSMLKSLAGAQGFEPWSSDPETDVLPLYYAPVEPFSIYNNFYSVKFFAWSKVLDTIK